MLPTALPLLPISKSMQIDPKKLSLANVASNRTHSRDQYRDTTAKVATCLQEN